MFKSAGVALEDALLAKHDLSKGTWSVLLPSAQTKKAVNKGRGKGKVLLSATKGGARNVLQAPWGVKDGDLIGVLSLSEMALEASEGKAAALAFDCPLDRALREARAAQEASKREGKEGKGKAAAKSKGKAKEVCQGTPCVSVCVWDG